MIKNDVDFVHNLYGQANEKPQGKIDVLFFSIIILLSLLIVWANFAEVDELARGEGKVIPSSKIQSIQSLDGGLIEEILVKEGEKVLAGQPLMKIDITRFQATFEENKESYNQWIAMQVRLELEASFDINKPIPTLNYTKEIQLIAKDYIESEKNLFINRVTQLKTSLEVFDSQIAQKRHELKEIQSKISQLNMKQKLVKVERETIMKMVQSGVKSKVDLIMIEKEYQQIRGDLESLDLSIPRSKSSILESITRREEKINEFRSSASSELQRISVEIKKVEARMVSDSDKLEKTVIKSSVDGTVKEIFVNTIGGVIKSGMGLMDIIPESDNLLIEAKIDPKDIAFINPSQEVMIKITAYDFTIYGGLTGEIVEISADSIVDKDNQDVKSYYKIIVKTDKNYLIKNGDKLPIIPGMIATVDIVTGKKSIMDYILKPILKIKQNSLHEK
jgi:adhesin transport system membrane fusion protein